MSMDNLGKSIPTERLEKGYNFVESILPDASKKLIDDLIGYFKKELERDRTHTLISSNPCDEICTIDLTARYRLIAILLT